VALIQATETLKLLAGIGESLAGRLLQIDALGMEFREFRIQKDPKCPACGEQPTLTGLIDYEEFCGMPTQPGPDLRETNVADLKRALASGEDLLLLDVREPSEHARARIEGARLLPLGQLEARLGELDAWRTRRVVVHCHHGGRSAHACLVLREHGFQRVENLAGGIDAWSLAVDPSVPRY
jgi:sulfur-carrier protein adenylyltransferase/sulfurtransferase